MKTSTAIIVVGGLALVLGGVLLSRRRTTVGTGIGVPAPVPAPAPNRQYTTAQQRSGWSAYDPTTPQGAANLGSTFTGISNLVDSIGGLFGGDSSSSGEVSI